MARSNEAAYLERRLEQFTQAERSTLKSAVEILLTLADREPSTTA